MLGLERNTVILDKSKSEWTVAYQEERKRLKELLENYVIDIQHVGSTSINNIKAKPIIDIAVGIENLDCMNQIKDILIAAGYLYHENHDKDRFLFVKGPEERRTHYIHIHQYGSQSWSNQIFFRDYLNEHIDEKNEYERLKVELSKMYANDRKKYTSGKDKFIKSILVKNVKEVSQ